MEPPIEDLYILLQDLAVSGIAADQYELYTTLEDYRARLLGLFDIGARNTQEKQQVQSGQIKYKDSSLLLNDEFKTATLALSEQLDCSELYCARLLKEIETQHPNVDPNARMERAIVRHHDERFNTVRCLQILFGSGQLDDVLEQFREQLMTTMIDLPGGRRVRIAEKVLVEIDNVTKTLGTVATALSHATTAATAPYKFTHGALALREQRLLEERRQLGELVLNIASTRRLIGVEITRIIDWLATHGHEDATPSVLAAALAALDPNFVNPDSGLYEDKTFISHVLRQFDAAKEWLVPGIKATLQLQWACFLRNSTGNEDAVEKAVWDAVQGDAFLYIGRIVRADDEYSGKTCRPELLGMLEDLLIGVIVYMSPVLRRIKHKQEDVGRADVGMHMRQDIAVLCTLVGDLYLRLPLDSGLKFWTNTEYDGRLGSFVRWAAEARDPAMMQATFEMVAGLSTGRNCAELAFNFLAIPGASVLSWVNLFAALDGFHSTAQQPGVAIRHDPNEVYLTVSFLKVMRNVAKHSPAARLALHHHPQFRVLQTMLALVPAPIPLELKAALLDAAAAFCMPGAGTQGVDLCKTVWSQMERVALVRGAERELEMVEGPARMYPVTSAVVPLLCSLIHTSKDLRAAKSLFEAEPRETMPEGVNAAPYVSFVIDTVLLRASKREYDNDAEKWGLLDSCLAFVERALAAIDPGLPMNPLGGEVLRRMLTDTGLRKFILDFVDEGASVQARPQGNAILRALRIIVRVLEIQQYFLDIPFQPGLVGLDEALSWTPRHVVQLALYVVANAGQETVLCAIKILDALSVSPAFKERRIDRLALILQGSEDSWVIQDGFVRILREEDNGLVDQENVEAYTGAGAPPREDDSQIDLTATIKDAVVALLLRGTTLSVASPGIAHFLLGYDIPSSGGEAVIQDPEATNARVSCLHIVFKALSAGIPRLQPGVRHVQHQQPIATLFPILAEKYYRLVLQLCTHGLTAAPTMRYLRTREDFFARHLSALPPRIPSHLGGENIDGAVVYEDGTSLRIKMAGAATAFLRLRAWVYELVALELHVLMDSKQYGRATHLLELVFGVEQDQEQRRGMQDEFLQPFGLVASRHASRLVEALQGLYVKWVDGLQPETGLELQTFRGLNFDSCIKQDEVGCEVYDVDTLLSLLSTATGKISSTTRERFLREIKYVLETATVENHSRGIRHARALGYAAWAQVVQIAVSKGLVRLSQDMRERVLFDILNVVPTALQRMEPVGAESLAQTLVILVARLREERRQHADISTSALPAERLESLFRSILECVMAPGAASVVRGNLYSALTHYLQLVEAEKEAHARFSEADEVVRTELESGALSIVNEFVERLIPEVCKDAMDGAEVWKTVAFTFLDSLVRLSRTEKRHLVLHTLARTGYLQNFVLDLKHSEDDLFRILGPDPDDLNALYIYEAKMTFLIRIAQTRQGADEVYRARLFSTLATCEYLDARPDVEDAYLDDTSFLPSVLTRYHQLLLPALQLVDSVLSSASIATATASKQALSFVIAHRETLLAILRDIPPRVTLSVLSILQLVVSLCSFVVPQVPQAELTGYSGFGGLHAVVLAIASRYLSSRYGATNARVADEAEYELTKMRAPGYGVSSSVFEVRLYDAVALLRKWCIVYLAIASRCGAGSSDNILFVLLMTPPGREGDVHPTALVSGPTISDAISALSEASVSVEGALKNFYDLSTKIHERDTLNLDEIDEIAASSGLEVLQELDVPQRRVVAFLELERARVVAHSRFLSSLHVLEMLLLLICEHLQHDWRKQSFSENSLNLGASTAGPLAGFGSIAGATSADTTDRIRRQIQPTLSKVEGLQLPREVLGPDASSRQKFVDTLCRRINEAITDPRTLDEDDDMS